MKHSILNDKLSKKEQFHLTSITALVLACTSAVFVFITKVSYPDFFIDTVVLLILFSSCFLVVRAEKLVLFGSVFTSLVILGSIMRFFFTPESHDFVRVWVPVAAIFVLYNIGKYYRKVFSSVMVLLVFVSSYYYYAEVVGELNWNLIFSITFAVIFSCSLTVYLLSQYERKTDEIKDLAISIELKNELLSRSSKLSKSGYFQYRIDGESSYYSKEIKELYETENIKDHLKVDKELFLEDFIKCEEQVTEAFKNEKPFYLYTRSLIKGETRRFVSRCKVYKENGVVVGFEGTTSDVSDIYNAKDELEIFRKVVENIPIKVYLVTKKGIIKFANQAVVNATGFSKAELINQPASKLSMRNEFSEVLQKMEAAGKGVPIFKEVTGKSKDGSLTKSELCVCLIDYQGEEVILGVTRDLLLLRH